MSAKIYTPLKAMRLKCLDCCCGSSQEVEKCPVETCTLWPYRLGKSPTRKKRILTEDERQTLVERLSRTRAKKTNLSDSDTR